MVNSDGTYTVENGDYGTAIAEKLTGDGMRWRELLDVNPERADPKWGIRLYAGDVIRLPEGWVSSPAPVVVPSGGGGVSTGGGDVVPASYGRTIPASYEPGGGLLSTGMLVALGVSVVALGLGWVTIK